jgi:hypothetical protein
MRPNMAGCAIHDSLFKMNDAAAPVLVVEAAELVELEPLRAVLLAPAPEPELEPELDRGEVEPWAVAFFWPQT